jgi:hypothetical protein
VQKWLFHAQLLRPAACAWQVEVQQVLKGYAQCLGNRQGNDTLQQVREIAFCIAEISFQLV